METKPMYTRPTFEEALDAWQKLLSQRGLPSELTWIFDENLCFEKDPGRQGGFRLGFQTAFTPPPPDAARIAYDYFSGFQAPVVFYRIGSHRDKSVCLLLCDKWFENKKEAEGYLPRESWLMYFR